MERRSFMDAGFGMYMTCTCTCIQREIDTCSHALYNVYTCPLCVHLVDYSRSSDTLLGESGDPTELFVSETCDDNPLGAIMGKVHVS